MNIEQGIFLVAREALSLDQAMVLEDNEHYRLIDDPKAGVFYICLGDQECDLSSLLHEARKKVIQPGSFVHFYIDDYHFERIWNNPERYLPLLQRYDGVIGTDFSQLANMPYPQRLWNCYRNRLLGSWMQKHGINYIHNVTWSLPDSYDYSFEGLPAGSVIAINCAGIAGSPTSKYLWYRGYEEALSRLKPVAIVRYGTRMLEENEAISRYFENERLNLLRNGR